MKNLQIIEAHFLSPTISRGARIKLVNTRFNQSKIISFNHKTDMIIEAMSYFDASLIVGINYNEIKKFYSIILDADSSHNFLNFNDINFKKVN